MSSSIRCDPVRNSLCFRLDVAQVVWFTSTETHVNETDGSCTNPSQASLEGGKDKCERHANVAKGSVRMMGNASLRGARFCHNSDVMLML